MKRLVAFVCERLQARGAERILIHLATHLDRAEFEPVIVLFERGNAFAGELRGDVGVITLPPGPPAPLHTDVFNGWSERVAEHLPMNARLHQALESLGPEAIVSLTSRCNLRLSLEADRLPAPLVIGEMSLPRRIIEAQYPPALQAAIWSALPAIYRAPARIVAVARVVSEQLGELGVASEVIPPAVDLSRIAARVAAAPDHRWLRDGTPVLIQVGALAPAKNHELTLRALRRNDARLLIVGDGPRRAELEAVAKREGVADRVDFLGHVAEPLSWLARADVFVQSSHFEGTPTAVLEAMACGVPVVATAVGGTPEVVEDGRTGLLAAPEEGAMAAAIGRMIADRDLRERCRTNARAAVEAYDAPVMAARYAALLRAL